MFGREECEISGLRERRLGLEKRAGRREESGVSDNEGAGFFSDVIEAAPARWRRVLERQDNAFQSVTSHRRFRTRSNLECQRGRQQW